MWGYPGSLGDDRGYPSGSITQRVRRHIQQFQAITKDTDEYINMTPVMADLVANIMEREVVTVKSKRGKQSHKKPSTRPSQSKQSQPNETNTASALAMSLGAALADKSKDPRCGKGWKR